MLPCRGAHKQHPGGQDTRYPSSFGISKIRDNVTENRLVPRTFSGVWLGNQSVPAALLLPALQQQATLDFKCFIHFLIPTHLNIFFYRVKLRGLPPGGSVLASGKCQLGNK